MTTGNEIRGIGRQSQMLYVGRHIRRELIIALAALQIIRTHFKEELIDKVLAFVIALIEGLLIESCRTGCRTIDSEQRDSHCHGKDEQSAMESEHTVFSLFARHGFQSSTCNVPGPRTSQHPKVAFKTRIPSDLSACGLSPRKFSEMQWALEFPGYQCLCAAVPEVT
jgi:hypothetical protein